MKRLKIGLVCGLVALSLLCGIVSALPPAVDPASIPLGDLWQCWAKEDVLYGVEKGYITGYEDGTFRPDNAVTRAEFATMINRAFGIQNMADISFYDIEPTDWYYEQVRKAVYAGYVNGYEDGSFGAARNITRQEAAVILSRLVTPAVETGTIEAFSDASAVADWAKDAMELAFSKKYITGDDKGRLLPTDSLTRAQAAKILHVVMETETVVGGDYAVKLDKAALSRVIFTGNVTVDNPAASALKIDTCRIFGTLDLKNASALSATVTQSQIASLRITAPQTSVLLDDASSVKTADVFAPATLTGDKFGKVTLAGDGLAAGIVSLTGRFDDVTVATDAAIRADRIGKLAVDGKASVLLQNGTVDAMTVSASSSGSVITLSNDVEITSLDVAAPAAFMGQGVIRTANNRVSGVSYAVMPEKITGKDAGDTPADNTFSASSFSPANGATGVSANARPTVTYASRLYTRTGGTLTADYAEDAVTLRKGSSSGTSVPFEISVASSGREITVFPDSTLASGTRYYLTVKGGMFADGEGAFNKEQTVSFTVSGSSDTPTGDVTFSVKNGASDVPVNPAVTVSFPSAIQTYDEDIPTSKYLSTTAFELRAKSTTGTKVGISVTVNSTRRSVSVTPDSPLDPATKYYLILCANSLRDASGKVIAKTSISFTTADELSYQMTPSSGATGVLVDDEILLTFNGVITRPSGSNVTASYLSEIVSLHRSTVSGTAIDCTVNLTSDKKTIRIVPSYLDAGTKYYVCIDAGKLANASGTTNKKIAAYFTTATQMAPSFLPANGATDVSLTDDILIRFTDVLYTKGGTPITPADVRDNIVFKKGSSSGSKVDFLVSISDDGTSIIVSPLSTLKPNTKYYVSFGKSIVYNAAKKANAAGNITFTTGVSKLPDFLPYDGETGISVSPTIEVTFEEKMTTATGKALTASYIKNDVLTLYAEDGAAVSYTATVSSDSRTISIKPSSKLAGDTRYIVSIRKSSLMNSSGELNERYSSSFVTEEVVSGNVTFYPKSGETGVSVNTNITVLFDSAIYRIGGDNVTASYLENNVFELRKGSTSGAEIAFAATVDETGKMVELIPYDPLDPSTTYVVRLLSGTLEYANGTRNTSKTDTFKTGDGKPVVSDFRLVEAKASTLTVSVTSTANGYAHFTVTDAADPSRRTEIGNIEVYGLEPLTYELTGLQSGRTYNVSVYIEAGSVTSNVKTMTMKTTKAASLAVSDVGDRAADVTVSAYCPGELSLSYKLKSGGESVSRVGGLSLNVGDRTFTLSPLQPETEYVVTAEFVDEYGVSTVMTGNFKTQKAKEEQLAITSLILTDENGDTYTASVKNEKASVTTENTLWVRIKGVSTVENAVFNIGSERLEPEEFSEPIAVTPGAVTNIDVILTSADTGNKAYATLEIAVNE